MERVALGVKEVDALRGDEDGIAPGEFMLRRLVAGESRWIRCSPLIESPSRRTPPRGVTRSIRGSTGCPFRRA